jgi:hypothetical protein
LSRKDFSSQDHSNLGKLTDPHNHASSPSLIYHWLFSKGFAKDDHVPDLLLFHPLVQFHDDLAYTSAKVILQDKASCFPAIVLAPPIEDDIVVIGGLRPCCHRCLRVIQWMVKDATAAPGNKTSHLSALMGNKGTVSKGWRFALGYL